MITVISDKTKHLLNDFIVNLSRVAQSCLFKLSGRIVPAHKKARLSQPTFEGGINSVMVT